MNRLEAMSKRAAAALFAASVCLGAAAQDVPRSADPELFPNRMPGYTISVYQVQGFASYAFRTRPPQPIEGRYTRVHYYLKDPKQNPGGLAIRRNYENAIKAIGGELVHSDDNVSVLKVTRNGVETWAEIQASTKTPGRIYFVHVVERTPMAQVVTAEAMAAAIDKSGSVALDVHFATGKADILPESQPLIEQAVKMLKDRPNLRVAINGHTDSTGTPEGNRTLSAARAKSVVASLVAGGIAANRLSSAGFGQDRPVADNASDEGRARNRRVEIVKR